MLCSVEDVRAVVAEVRRVLRPGGTFVCVEHVAAPTFTGLWALQVRARASERRSRSERARVSDGA